MKKKVRIIIMSMVLFVAIIRIADLKGYTQNPDSTADTAVKTESITGDTVNKEVTGENETGITKDDTGKNVTANNNGNGEIEGPVVRQKGNLFATIIRGGPLMIVLVLLGLAALTLIIERVFFFTKHNVWQQSKLNELLHAVAGKSKAVYREDLEDELKATFQIYASKMERGLSLLSGIGNISPIVGFLGTVIGMISAFASIAAATTVNAKVVAVGIQIALVTTAGGLTVAVPTLACFYLFSHVIQNRYSQANGIISRLCESKQRISDSICDQ